jgi:hypothetical protein
VKKIWKEFTEKTKGVEDIQVIYVTYFSFKIDSSNTSTRENGKISRVRK